MRWERTQELASLWMENGEEVALQDAILDVLKELGLDNERLYRELNRAVNSYEFNTVARLIKVHKLYLSCEGEQFIFLGPVKDGKQQYYVNSSRAQVMESWNIHH